MEGFLGRYATYIYAILRIVTGFLFMWHGSQKLLGYPLRELPPGAPPPAGLDIWGAVGGGIELIGGLLIMIGLFTSFAAFISSGMMAVAYWFWHFGAAAWLPIQNRGELAVLYCFVLLYIAARGSGVWSVESAFKGSRSAVASG
jgi:putative oxidoreductase